MTIVLLFAALVTSGYTALRFIGRRKRRRDLARERSKLAHPAFQKRINERFNEIVDDFDRWGA